MVNVAWVVLHRNRRIGIFSVQRQNGFCLVGQHAALHAVRLVPKLKINPHLRNEKQKTVLTKAFAATIAHHRVTEKKETKPQQHNKHHMETTKQNTQTNQTQQGHMTRWCWQCQTVRELMALHPLRSWYGSNQHRTAHKAPYHHFCFPWVWPISL